MHTAMIIAQTIGRSLKMIMTKLKNGNLFVRISVLVSGILFFFIPLQLSQGRDTSSSNPTYDIAIGHVDRFIINGKNFTAEGWGVSTDALKTIDSIIILIGGKTVYNGKFEKFDRPDVVTAMSQSSYLNSGWRINGTFPNTIILEKHSLAVQLKMNTGELVELPITKQNQTVKKKINAHRVEIYLLSFSVICVLITFCFAERLVNAARCKWQIIIQPWEFPCYAMILLFICLVASGITGSSLNFGLRQVPFIQTNGSLLWGNYQPIRSDEWLVATPLALAQKNHSPAFPIINKNLGENGQNMLVVSGVPVWHISALSKPATWGFFVFPLRHALSWYWWFPLFGCFFALWSFFDLICPNNWRTGFMISLLFCTSAYVTAWSYGPAYTVFFPCIATYSSISILREQQKVSTLILWSILFGISGAGFVLILYPPWQISLGYLFLSLAAGIILRDKLYQKLNLLKVISISLGIGIAGIILWQWWTDAQSAIHIMVNTVYPGQRTLITGGTYSIVGMLRGFTNLITLYCLGCSYSNPSEIASFYYMIPGIIILFYTRKKQGEINSVHFILSAFILLELIFLFIGFPKKIAEISLWGRVPETRADLSLGLAHLILIGMLLSSRISSRKVQNFFKPGILGSFSITPIDKLSSIRITRKSLTHGIAAFLWGVLILYVVVNMIKLSPWNSKYVVLAIVFIYTVTSSWSLASGKRNIFLLVNLLFSLITICKFNPIAIAPSVITKTINLPSSSKVVTLGDSITAMMLLATGQKVYNGIFHYPQRSFWERFDSDRSKSDIYNRYQHLVIRSNEIPDPYFNITNPGTDTVVLSVSPEHFDFRTIGADILLAPTNLSKKLSLNKSLKFTEQLTEKSAKWSKFKIDELPGSIVK